ncbi:uncharacterized protein [Amphiura filiformis]|uniref:uncharacterized protein isoform X5 n=1 Tax=Amphiura filiformis TaxID=82378 RepID=UPI003B213C59
MIGLATWTISILLLCASAQQNPTWPGTGTGNRQPGTGTGTNWPGTGPGNRQPGTGTGTGTNWPGTGTGNNPGIRPGTGTGTGTNPGTRPGTGTGNNWPGTGTGTGTGTRPGTGTGTRPGTGAGNNPGTRPGTGAGNNPGTRPGTGTGNNWPGTGTGTGTRPGTGAGNNPGTRPGTGTGNNWPGTGTGTGTGTRPGTGAGNNPGTRPGTGTGNNWPGTGTGTGTRPGTGAGNNPGTRPGTGTGNNWPGTGTGTGTRPGTGTGNNWPGTGAGNNPGTRPGTGTGNNWPGTGTGTGTRPGTGAGNNPGTRPGTGTGNNWPGTGAGNNPGTRPGTGTGNNWPGTGTGTGTGNNWPGTGAGNNPGNRPGTGTGNNWPGTGAGNTPGNRPGTGTGNNWPGTGAGNNPGNRPGTGTGNNWPGTGAGNNPGNRPGTGTGNNWPGTGAGNNPGNRPGTGNNWPGTGTGTGTGTGNNWPGTGTGNNRPGTGWNGYNPNSRTNFRDNDAKVLVLGAGPAGLQAVKYLTDNGINDFIMIEGSPVVGGKLKKIEFGQPRRQYETGAMWIYPPTKPLLDRYGVRYHRNMWEDVTVRSDRGIDLTRNNQLRQRRRDLQNATRASRVLGREISMGRRSDISIKTALAMYGWVDSSPMDHALEWFDFDFEEGVQSKDVSFFGRFKKAFEAHEQYFITDRRQGLFSDVIQRLDADHLRSNEVVTSIQQSGRQNKVTVQTERGTRFTGEYAIVTFSIGVLQSGKVNFSPPLPGWKTEQIFRYQMGTLDPIFMRFTRKFWPDTEWILHASERRGKSHYFPAFLNLEARGLFPRGTNTLVGFVTGEEAMRLEAMEDRAVRAEVWHVVKSMFGAANVPNIVEFYFERWATHPLHYGSFSTFPVGADRPADAMQRLAAPFNSIYFAQDATDKAIGTVSGSVSAGERAATQIASCIRNRRNCPQPYRPRNAGNRPPGCQTGWGGQGANSGSRIVVYPVAIMFASLLGFILSLW